MGVIRYFLKSCLQPSGGVGVIYKHAKNLIELGFKCEIVHPSGYYHKQSWLEFDPDYIPHLNIDEVVFNDEDIIVFGECFATEMRTYKDIPGRKVVFCQSHLYISLDMQPNETWVDFNVHDVIVVQEPLKYEIDKIFGSGLFNIHKIKPSISDEIFNLIDKETGNYVAISSRNVEDFNKIEHFLKALNIKSIHMVNMDRKTYANVLKNARMAVWIDEIAGFGTFPIECTKVGTPLLMLKPKVMPEYIINGDIKVNIANNLIALPGRLINLLYDDDELKRNSSDLIGVGGLYGEDEEKNALEKVFSDLLNNEEDKNN